MENENNNYSFTPITEDNSVNEIKDDFFGGSNPEPSASPTNEVPPILEVPEIKEEETSVSTPAPGPIVNDVVESNNNAETTVELAPVTDPEPTVEKVNQEPTEPVTNEEVTVSPKPITEINAVSAEEATSEPVEVKIPEGLDDEPSEVASAEETAADSTPQVETTTAQVTNPEAKAEAPKKGKSIFDFFKSRWNRS